MLFLERLPLAGFPRPEREGRGSMRYKYLAKCTPALLPFKWSEEVQIQDNPESNFSFNYLLIVPLGHQKKSQKLFFLNGEHYTPPPPFCGFPLKKKI